MEIVPVLRCFISYCSTVNFDSVFYEREAVACAGLACYITTSELLFKQLVPLIRGHMRTCAENIEFDPVLVRSEKVLNYSRQCFRIDQFL